MRFCRNIVLVISVIISVLLVSSAYSYAAEAEVSLSGNETVETGTTQTVLVKIKNDEEIGVIQGKIVDNQNVDIVNIEACDNNWVVNYNSTTKQFNAYYANGVKDGDVLAIKYKLKTGASSGTIKLTEVKLTTIGYTLIDNIEVAEKNITGKASSGSESKEKQPSSTSESSSSESSNGISNQQKKSANGIIPQLGQSGKIFIAIIGATLVAVISYKKLRNRA